MQQVGQVAVCSEIENLQIPLGLKFEICIVKIVVHIVTIEIPRVKSRL